MFHEISSPCSFCSWSKRLCPIWVDYKILLWLSDKYDGEGLFLNHRLFVKRWVPEVVIVDERCCSFVLCFHCGWHQCYVAIFALNRAPQREVSSVMAILQAKAGYDGSFEGDVGESVEVSDDSGAFLATASAVFVHVLEDGPGSMWDDVSSTRPVLLFYWRIPSSLLLSVYQMFSGFVLFFCELQEAT